jgi:DNA-binding GntR family transcriptional regulator
MLRELPRGSLAGQAYHEILRAIVVGELEPGARIRDVDLGARLGVSRTPVREALRRLVDDGLVETAPDAYTRVTPLAAADAEAAYPVVAALQALGARLGVPRLSDGDVAQMERLDRERGVALAARDVVGAIDLDDRFHAVVLDAAGNAELQRALDRLMPKVRRLDLLHFGALADRADESRHDHDALLRACRARDAETAARLVEESYLRLGARVAQILPVAPEAVA